jgi:hypothetical protein
LVYLSLVGNKKESTIQCSVYLVEPKRYEELRQALHAKLAKVHSKMENLQRGLEGRN